MSRFDDQVLDDYKRPVPGVSVYVYDDAGQLEDLTADDASPLDNPLTTDIDGRFYFNADDGEKMLEYVFAGRTRYKQDILVGPPDPGPQGPAGDLADESARAALAATPAPAANMSRYLNEAKREGLFVFDASNLAALVAVDTEQAMYVAPANDPTGASGAWVRKYDGAIEFDWWGPAADDATDDGPKMDAACRLLEALSHPARINGTIYRAAPAFHVSKGKYYLGTHTIEPLTTVKMFGDGGKGWSVSTQFRFAANTTALRLQAHNTSGASAVDGVQHFAGEACFFEDMCFIGAYNTAAPNEGEYHGIHAKRPVAVARCTFSNFQGDGCYINASVGGGVGSEGNANNSRFNDCVFEANRNGNYIRGSDANVISFRDCDFRFNRQWGSNDASFLHNSYFNCHSADNGIQSGQPMPTMVHYLGNRFVPITGQEAGAAVNAPPATATDNTWWRFAYAGGASGTIIPTWANPTTVRAGGSYTGSSWLSVCYEEGGQGPCVINTPGGVNEGLITNKGSGGFARTDSGWSKFGAGPGSNGIWAVGRSIFENGPFEFLNGDASLDSAAPKFTFKLSGAAGAYFLQSGSTFYVNAPGGGGFIWRLNGGDMMQMVGTYLFPTADNSMDFGFAGTNRWKNIYAMIGNYSTQVNVGGNKVLGARGASLPADATDLATALTLLNAIKARLKVTGGHGLVAD